MVQSTFVKTGKELNPWNNGDEEEGGGGGEGRVGEGSPAAPPPRDV